MPDYGDGTYSLEARDAYMDDLTQALREAEEARQDFLLMKENRDRWKAIAEALYEGAKQDGSGNHLPLIEAYHRYEKAKRNDS